jgi:hypothetical protein
MSSQFIYDLGPLLTEHCLKVAAFASDKQNKNGKDEDYLPILLALSTPSYFFLASEKRGDQNKKYPIYENAAALTSAWFNSMKIQHEKLISEKISSEAEECAEISSLFVNGVCAGRSSVAITELESVLQNGASMSGIPALMKPKIFTPYVEFLSSRSGGAPISVEKATKTLLRAWADVNLQPDWFASSSSSSSSFSKPQLHSISYSVSPDLKIRFRISSPPLIKSEVTKKQIVVASNSSDFFVFRDIELVFDDDEIIPGTSIAPLVKKYKEVVCSVFGGIISTQQLQKSFIKLQKLFGDSLNGVLEPTSNNNKKNNNNESEKSSSTSAAAVTADTTANSKKNNSFQKASIAKLYTDPENALKDVDLQDADEVTVQEYKDKMTEKFNANVIKPGDPGYVYDKRVEANPTEKSEWDSDDD